MPSATPAASISMKKRRNTHLIVTTSSFRDRQPSAGKACRSSLALPATLRRLLPVGCRVTGGFHGLPVATRLFHLAQVVTVKHEDGPVVAGQIGRFRAVDHEPDARCVRVARSGGQQHRLMLRMLVVLGAVREEGIVAIGP